MPLAALNEDAFAQVSTRPASKTGSMVRLLTCGSVDDGKSTLIGRMLWDSSAVTQDQQAAVLHASHSRTVNGERIDFSLLLDGLQAER
jgi:bifunctional enzyme CysN/CysC